MKSPFEFTFSQFLSACCRKPKEKEESWRRKFMISMDKIPENDVLPYIDSDKRMKIDGYILFRNGVAEDIKDANIGKGDLKSLESEHKYDLRKSLAWDSAFSTSSGFLEVEELFNILNSRHSKSGCDILGQEEEDQLLSVKYPEPEIKSVTDEFNLRKSLAWDSAFFTSEGILNPEELSLVNKGFKKSETNMLPRIEELWISYESNCTIELANSEVKLSEDFGTSTSTRASSSRKQRYRDMQKTHSTKRMDGDGVPKLKVKSRPTSRRQTLNDNQPERIAKDSSTSPLRKISSGSGTSDLSSPPKPPKILGRVRNIPRATTKSVPLFSNEVNGKSKIVKATNGKCLIEKPDQLKNCSKNDTLNCNSSACIYTITPQSEYRKTNQITPENCSPVSSTSTAHRCHGYMTLNGSCRKFCNDNNASAQSDLELQPHSQSNVSHNDRENMCPNVWTEVNGSNSVSFDASRYIKPSGLRMPTPKIGFFDVDNSLLAKENGGGKSQNGVVKVGACSRNLNAKFQTAPTLRDVRNTKI